MDDDVEDFLGRFRAGIKDAGLKTGGYVTSCQGNLVECQGIEKVVSVGDTCWIETNIHSLGAGPAGLDPNREAVLSEVVALRQDRVTLLPYAELDGVSLGNRVLIDPEAKVVRPSLRWRGRVMDALGDPIDGQGPLGSGAKTYPLLARPIAAHKRRGLGGRLNLGVKAMDIFTPCCAGQRLGIFAGSGVGKSSLISMIAKQSDADVMVIGLIGERGRELHEFLHNTLGPAGLARSIVVVATSDMPAMMRRRAAYLSLTIAEFLRDRGLNVLCLLDSVTRFAMALREIYLAAGEPPTTKGYPPSVFSEMPRLMERAGPGDGDGSITGLFSVLVEGDDTNEPVSDTVRGILDGHIIMDRQIAERGRFPAIDILKSISRTAPGCYSDEERALVQDGRGLMRLHDEMLDLIQLGAYQAGSNPDVDRAIRCHPLLETLLAQSVDLPDPGDHPWGQLAEILQS